MKEQKRPTSTDTYQSGMPHARFQRNTRKSCVSPSAVLTTVDLTEKKNNNKSHCPSISVLATVDLTKKKFQKSVPWYMYYMKRLHRGLLRIFTRGRWTERRPF